MKGNDIDKERIESPTFKKMGNFRCLHISVDDIDSVGNVKMRAKEI
jgi:hypothetical protein